LLKLTHSVGVIALFLTFPQCVRADDDSVARFYRGRQVIIDVGFGPGGSASLYAVTLSHHMGRFIPGTPTLTVQHMPGAGGLTVANYSAKFDGRKFNWLGTTNVEYTTCLAWHTSPVKTLQDAMQTPLIVGGTGSDATDVIFPRAINKIIGTKFKIIMGYPGSTEMDLAMERGELQGNCGLGWSVIKTRRQDWLKNNKINILFQMALEKHPDLPDVPLVLDYAKTPDDRKVLEFLFAPQEMGRPFFAPAGVPAERVDALRQAFSRTLQDPSFLNEAAKAGLEINLVDGVAVQKIVETMYATPPETLQRIRDIAAAK
jgi:tripartite-type tricarboxylate transporter receptor subunit TctC